MKYFNGVVAFDKKTSTFASQNSRKIQKQRNANDSAISKKRQGHY